MRRRLARVKEFFLDAYGAYSATLQLEVRMDLVTLAVIGTVKNGRDASVDEEWGALESAIELRSEFADGLLGLEQFSHVLVVFYMHRDPDGEAPVLQRRPRGRADMPLTGVFAQRGRMRPNPIGVTGATLVRVEAGRAIVRGLDALDGTPVLDLKPYVTHFDRVERPREPEWMTRLMRGYF